MSNQNTKNNIMIQGTILAAASLIVRLIGLIYRIPLNRILGDEAMGYYGTAFEFYNLALLLSSYSLPLAVSKLVSAREVKGQHRNSHRVFCVAMGFGAVVGSIATLVVYFGADLYGRLNKSPLVAIPLRVLAPTIFVFSVMGVIRGYFQGHNTMVPTAISQVIEQIVNAAVSIGAALYMLKIHKGDPAIDAYGAAGGTWGTFLGAVAAAITLIVLYLFNRGEFRKAEEQDCDEYRETAGMVLKMILITVLPVVVSQTIYQLSGMVDVTVFNRILSGKEYSDSVRNAWWGIYSNKYKLLTNVPIAIASAMGTAIVPGLIAVYVRNEMEEVRKRVASAVKFNMVIAFPCAFGMIFLARPILGMLFHDFSDTSAYMMTIGGICVVFFALSTVTNGILQGINQLQLPVIHSAIALVIHVVILAVLLRVTNLNCYALVICNVLFAVIVSMLNWRSIAKYLDYKQEIDRTFLRPMAASVIMGIGARGLYNLLHRAVNNLTAALAAIAFAIPVYFLVLIKIKGITREEMLDMPKGRSMVRLFHKLHLF